MQLPMSGVIIRDDGVGRGIFSVWCFLSSFRKHLSFTQPLQLILTDDTQCNCCCSFFSSDDVRVQEITFHVSRSKTKNDGQTKPKT